MNLVIVESPTKARTIGRYLSNDYTIKASMGHVLDLPKSTLAIDIEHDFAPQYEIIEDKRKSIQELKLAAKTAETIILATDPDREGEAIAAHVAELLTKDAKGSSRNSQKNSRKFARIVFHEITKEAIEEALERPRDIDANLVDAQTARRVLDRLVGYKLSPLLWQKVRRGLSAGRVQSVALRLIVEREKEIEKFKKENYFTITAVLKGDKHQAVEFELLEINSEKIELQSSFALYDGEYKVTKTTITTDEKAAQIIKDLQGNPFTISDVAQKEVRRNPQPPYTTSTLQQDASRRFGFSGKKTMSVAQKLYEEGFITYHRTDSVNLSKSAVFSLRSYAKKTYGDKYVPKSPRFYKTKQKLAQEAHEAIRPTRVDVQSSEVRGQMGNDYAKLYELIWKRAVACQMADAIIESTSVLADSQNQKSNIKDQKQNKYRFKANGSVLVFEGFLKVNPQALEDRRLPQYKLGEVLNGEKIDKIEHETQPPPRYNDASLIKTLEEKGIGRPSTYATIVSTIENRQYIERTEGRFKPTSIGIAVNGFLVENFSTIDDIPFTAEMEDQLDHIAQGLKKWVPVVREFYTPLAVKLKSAKDLKRVKIEVETTDEKCEECGSPMVVRIGRFGKFLSCSKFPECKFSKPFVEETNFTCPKDGGKVIVRKTRKGRRFYGCSNYPKCDFAAWKLKDIKKV
ncbi:MAG: type I DNA topoisomerase [Candidatus Levybacteria bacterium]|nr:type I DNA topoisomerase [Candidatus Levybacteria bacterium]